MISSTNNKAIDNIGLELLLEIPYFCDFAKTMEQDSTGPYSGSLCARLGNGKNIEHFYKYFFIPFYKVRSSGFPGKDVNENDLKAESL